MAVVHINPFDDISKIDALAQCPNCKRIWSYDGVDALLDYTTGTPIEGEASGNIFCRGCGSKARLFQETKLVQRKRN